MLRGADIRRTRASGHRHVRLRQGGLQAASCSGEREERMTRPRNRDISASTFSNCAVRTRMNSAEVFS